MQFGIKTNPQHTSWDTMLATWQRADSIDVFDSAWVFDHFYPITGDPNGPCLEGWTSLSALAQATQRIRVGTMVNGMPYRHPAITANMAATVDILSNGRLNLGLGAGWNELESNAYGISLGATLGERMDIFEEGVAVVVGLLSNETTNFDGTHFKMTEARCEPKGPQRPHPPIVIGGGGEKRTLRTVARFADHWNSPPQELDIWKHKRSVLDSHCEAVGRDPRTIMSSLMVRFDPTDPKAILATVETFGEAGVDAFLFNLPSPHDPGHVEQVAEVLSHLES
jgi:F420-dependent oxidoreductase-like protein